MESCPETQLCTLSAGWSTLRVLLQEFTPAIVITLMQSVCTCLCFQIIRLLSVTKSKYLGSGEL